MGETPRTDAEENAVLGLPAEAYARRGWKHARALEIELAAVTAELGALRKPSFQTRVDRWVVAAFGMSIARDKVERSHRFLEEALELAQAVGCSRADAIDLIDYVFSRPPGDVSQEVGGVMVTLGSLCETCSVDMVESGERELARIQDKIVDIREKRARKNPGSALP
jgi:NTP pyrophosphatase (non-canonical NTP hydrolase)